MEHLNYRHARQRPATARRTSAIVGVVASGNLEVLVEHVLPGDECEIDIRTPVTGFDAVWQAVVGDFTARGAVGGLRFSINDGGARPDMVGLRLAQALRAMEGETP
jgi:malonate decarboxylase delta subunit